MKSITFKNISFTYPGKKEKKVFVDLNLSLIQESKKGKVIAIMGSSGAGKTTLMKLILGIEKPNTGQIEKYPGKHIISYVPQEPVLFEHLTIQDNAEYFRYSGKHKKFFSQDLYHELVNSLGLKDILTLKNSVSELSGGQKQRLSLLRALSIKPDFLLLDEPCNGLDADVKRSFLIKLRELTQRFGFCVLYITHHRLEAELVADEIAYLVFNKKQQLVDHVVKDNILEFTNQLPVLESVHLFRFPDVKILPINNSNGEMILAENENDIVEWWFVEDNDFTIGDKDDLHFKVISQSLAFTIIKNDVIKEEWMLKIDLPKPVKVNDNIYIRINSYTRRYNKKGILISNDINEY